MKKIVLLTAAVLALAGCSEKEATKESSETVAQVQQEDAVFPMKERALLDEIQVVSFERYKGELTEQQIKIALTNYPQLRELRFVLGYIAEQTMKHDDETEKHEALLWYAESMTAFHNYISNMTFEELSKTEQQQFKVLLTPWLAKIHDTNDAIVTVNEAYEETQHHQALNQLLGYDQDVIITAQMLNRDLDGTLESLYGETVVSHVTEQGYERLAKLNEIVRNIQASYEKRFGLVMPTYSTKTIQQYFDYIDTIGDSPVGYLFDYTGEGPTGDEIVTEPSIEQPIAIYKEVVGSESVMFTENSTKVRAQPSIEAPIIYTGMLNETVHYNGVAYETPTDGRLWYEVQLNGQTGYVSSKVAKFTSNSSTTETFKNITITGVDVNVRMEPSIDSDVLTKVKKGDSLSWTGKSYPTEDGRLWYEVIAGQQLGYVSSKFVQAPR